MQSVIPPGDPKKTVVAGKSQGYLGLAINYTTVFDTGVQRELPAMVTAWQPTDEERAKIAAGAHIVVSIIGTPPINPMSLRVTDAPE